MGELGTAHAGTFSVASGELNARLAEAGVRAAIEVEDRLGGERLRRFELTFPKLRSFTIDALIHGVPLLRELQSLGQHVSAKQILPGVERLVGRGRLYRAIEACEPAAGAAPSQGGARERSLEELMKVAADAGADRERVAARAVDIFVRATRDKAAPKAITVDRSAPRTAHAALEAAVRQSACDLLAHPRVALLESAWRGLKLLSDQLPENGSVILEAADVRGGHELDMLQLREHHAQLPRPDVVLLTEPSAPLDQLSRYSAQAERLEAICIVALDPAQVGADRLDTLRRERDGVLGKRLSALRNDESARWLCLAANPVLLYSEELPGADPRLSFGSAAWGVGALVLAAQQKSARFTRMLGPDTLLKAPTFWVPRRGADAGMALPTLEFCSVRAQTELAELGVTALGSTRRGDEALVSRAPTAFGGDAPQSLASQLVIGRIVRAAREAGALLGGPGGELEATRIVEQGVPAGLERVIRVGVAIERDSRGRRLAIDAAADAFEALSPFTIAFALNL